MVDLTQGLRAAQSRAGGCLPQGIQESRADTALLLLQYKLVCMDLCHSLECTLTQGKHCSLVSSTPMTHDTLYSKGVPGDCLCV